MPLFILVILAAIVLYVISVYNGLVTIRTRIQASIQEIGNQLKRQSELIPNLEESAKGYLKHEKEIIRLLADARKSVAEAVSSGDLGKLSSAGEKVANLLPQIQVVMESNPQIKGADVITKLMDELRDTSDKVMYSRRTLIDLTADYNIKIVTFPSSIVANLFGFKSEKGLSTPATGSHLEVSDKDTATPKVKI
jgi:LemA protein